MELSETHIDLLCVIYDLEHHRIPEQGLHHLYVEFPEITTLLAQLIELDFVEYEATEQMYYLAYEGFEVVEEERSLKENTPPQYKSNTDQYRTIIDAHGGIKRFQRNTIVALLFFGILGSLFYYFFPETFEPDTLEVDPVIMEKMKVQLQEHLDSINQIQKLQNLDTLPF